MGNENQIKQEDGDEVVFECVICQGEIRPEQGDEFKHVQDSKTGRDLVFCGEDGTLLAQLISMDLTGESEFLGEVREKVTEKYAGTME